MDKTERSRLRKIKEIAKNQLNHTADLPPTKQLMVDGERFVAEFPMDPVLMSRLPRAERTFVKGRDFTIA